MNPTVILAFFNVNALHPISTNNSPFIAGLKNSFGNTGRDYVLRRLLRRSSRFGKQLGFNEPFLYKLVGTVCETMGDFYKELYEKRAEVEALILEEEKLFLKTLEQGMSKLDDILETVNDKVVSGYDAFKLYDTFGFPLELTEEIANEKGYTVDKEGFIDYMNKQREVAKKNNRNKTSMAKQKQVLMDFKKPSTFVYGLYRLKSSVLAIFSKDNLERELDHDGYIALKRTCFYAESGGQVADTGMITGKNFTARVVDVFKGPNGQHIHKVKLLSGKITVGDECEVIIDKERRHNIEANHSSVHMLQYALQTIISPKVMQAGSYVDDSKLRFDFTHFSPMTEEEIAKVEEIVNREIAAGLDVVINEMSIEDAKKTGAMALFGEKYGEVVRVVQMGTFSSELCGGTHVSNTRNISAFKIISESGVAAGVRRIEALTGKALFEYYNTMESELQKAAKLLKAVPLEVSAKIVSLQDEVKQLQKENDKLKAKLAKEAAGDMLSETKEVDGIHILTKQLTDVDMNGMRDLGDEAKQKLGEAFIVFASQVGEKVNLIAMATDGAMKKGAHAGNLIKEVASIVGGGGGGRPNMAQAGGKNPAKIPEALAHAKTVMEQQIKN